MNVMVSFRVAAGRSSDVGNPVKTREVSRSDVALLEEVRSPNRPRSSHPRRPGLEWDPFARRDKADVLQRALRSLPSQFREVLWRTEVEGESHQEIAETSVPPLKL
jgi:DNA-directed RNA polymerase specialized sigma24 family protein